MIGQHLTLTGEHDPRPFDYSVLDDETHALCRRTAQIASDYGMATRRSTEKGYELGTNLNEIKKRLKYGQFMAYVVSIGVPHYVATYWMRKVKAQQEIVDIYNLPDIEECTEFEENVVDGTLHSASQEEQTTLLLQRMHEREQEAERQAEVYDLRQKNEQLQRQVGGLLDVQRSGLSSNHTHSHKQRSAPNDKGPYNNSYRQGEALLVASVKGVKNRYKLYYPRVITKAGFQLTLAEIDTAQREQLIEQLLESRQYDT